MMQSTANLLKDYSKDSEEAVNHRCTQNPPVKLGHRRRPSIGKSMPVTALLLNFPPPPSQTKNYETLSRDGLSPELEKPPIYFHLSDVNESSSSRSEDSGRDGSVDRDFDFVNFDKSADHLDGNKLLDGSDPLSGDIKLPELSEGYKTFASDQLSDELQGDSECKITTGEDSEDFQIEGSGLYAPCFTCTAGDKNLDLLSISPYRSQCSSRATSPFRELCSKLCDSQCQTTTSIVDLEDFGKNTPIRELEDITNKATDSKLNMTKLSMKSMSKMDEQRRQFLDKMLTASGASNINNNDVCMKVNSPSTSSSQCSDSYTSCSQLCNSPTDMSNYKCCIINPSGIPSTSQQNAEHVNRSNDKKGNSDTATLPENFNIKDFREKFAIAEALAKTSMMTSPAARRRLAARKIEMEYDFDNNSPASAYGSDDERDFVPPKQLLLYLVRMGSFNSAPKINNTDSQDDDTQIPSGLTSHDLVQHCKIMRGESGSQLLTRYFLKPVTSNSIITNEISDGLRVLSLDSVSKVCSAPLSSPKHLRILQWNVLSQSLGQNNDGFVRCPEEALIWENRKYLIIEEIVQNNPDIVCLQEVDHFKFLERVLGSQNYCGIFFPKPDSPCLYIQENNGPDGCAIFYRRDKFDLINFDTRILEVWRVQSNQVAIAANFRVKETGKEFCVSTTHLKARNGALLSKLRNEQGKDLLRFVNNCAQNRPVLLCGDFNAEPVEPIYSTVLNYKSLGLSSAYADSQAYESSQNQNEATISNGSSGSQQIDDNEKCVNGSEMSREDEEETEPESEELEKVEPSQTYAEISAGREPPYTTWKIREEGEVCHTIDYVFYSKNHMKVLNCLMFPQENEIGQNRTPSLQYPSDHFSLVCDFELLDESDKN